MPRNDKIQDEKGQKHGPRKGKPEVQLVLLGLLKPPTPGQIHSPPPLLRGTVSRLELPQEDFSGVLGSRAQLLAHRSLRIGTLVPLFSPPVLSVVLDVLLWHPTDPPSLEEPHTAGCSQRPGPTELLSKPDHFCEWNPSCEWFHRHIKYNPGHQGKCRCHPIPTHLLHESAANPQSPSR